MNRSKVHAPSRARAALAYSCTCYALRSPRAVRRRRAHRGGAAAARVIVGRRRCGTRVNRQAQEGDGRSLGHRGDELA